MSSFNDPKYIFKFFYWMEKFQHLKEKEMNLDFYIKK